MPYFSAVFSNHGGFEYSSFNSFAVTTEVGAREVKRFFPRVRVKYQRYYRMPRRSLVGMQESRLILHTDCFAARRADAAEDLAYVARELSRGCARIEMLDYEPERPRLRNALAKGLVLGGLFLFGVPSAVSQYLTGDASLYALMAVGGAYTAALTLYYLRQPP